MMGLEVFWWGRRAETQENLTEIVNTDGKSRFVNGTGRR
jgi:hypothetical protein